MTERQLIRSLLSAINARPLMKFSTLRSREDVPNTHGVYVIRTRSRHPVHVGRTYRGKGGLRHRLLDHMGNRSSFCNVYLNGKGNRLRRGYTFQFLEVSNDRDRALLEYLATAWHCPRHLGVHAKVAVASK